MSDSSDEETTIDVKGLDRLIKMLGKEAPVARVGVLGSNSARTQATGSKSSPTNAEIGAAHEFGTSTLPVRSFLREPISEKLNKALEANNLFTEDTFREALEEGTLVPYMQKVAITAEAIVLGAFATGGYGKWKPSDMSRKTNHQTLVETQQLRNSITWDVKEAKE